jgi:nucleolar complex protein 3
MADLLVSATHFNFSENLMGVLVGKLARRTWDEVGLTGHADAMR